MKKEMNSYIKMNKVIIIPSLFLMIFIMIRAVFISLSVTINGIDLQEFASKRNTNEQILVAKRGTIYDVNGNILAQNVSAYTVIAYLDENISEDSKVPLHVVDKETTAEKLAPIIDMEKETILELLERDNVYQVELGPGGRGITELTKEEIELLELPGIDFVPSYKRYYPNANFASYTLGYAKTNEDGEIIGELGLESLYNKELAGENGYLAFQQDRLGYKIPNTPEIREEAINGKDIYLTIDSNIQFFVENALKEQYEQSNPEWLFMVVADAKTGKILANSSYPSFDPNIREIESYLNSLVSFEYEPGSTMKIFTYMAAIENGVYDGDDTFSSGHIDVGPDTINDWNKTGWGSISYDEGFQRSSNVGVTNLIQENMDRKMLLNYFQKLGFGTKTDINLPTELSGKIDFYYPIEVATAGFGQGITTTPIQYIRALTSIANDGELLNPYIIDKIEDSVTGEIEYQGEMDVERTVASKSTTDQIKELMYKVVNGDIGTGAGYKLEGYDVIGKTGTAQIAGSGGYQTGYNAYIYSFAGMYPKEAPEIIIYTAIKKPTSGGNSSLKTIVKEVVENSANYLNIVNSNTTVEDIINYDMPSLINKSVIDVQKTMNEKDTELIVLGEGTKVIDQFPIKDISHSSKEKVFVLTNDFNIKMPNIKGWSLREVLNLVNLLDLKYELEGYGSVVDQSIAVDEVLTADSELTIILEPSYVEIDEVIEDIEE